MSSANFCTNCGQRISPGARFCGACGSATATPLPSPAPQAPVYQNPPAPQPVQAYSPPAYQPPSPLPPYQPAPNYAQAYPPPQAMPPANETLIGIIPSASRKKNWMSTESFNIIVTNQRMVFAQMTPQMIKDEAARYRGGGLKGMFNAMTAGYKLWERYLQMPPDAALQETPGNFGLYLNQIRRVKFSGGKILLGKGAVTIGLKMNVGFGSDDDDNQAARLEIDSTAGKLDFEIVTQFQKQTLDALKGAGLIR